MCSALPKVLQPLGQRPSLGHVAEPARALDPERIPVVHGHGGEQVQSALGYLDVNWVAQPQQLGTGHAVQQAMAQIPDSAEVLVLYGDVPLVQAPTLQRLVATAGQQALALLSVVVAQPQGYGRIVRDEHGHIIAIVEEKDASAAELGIDEINTGLMCAPAATLRAWLARLNNDN